MQQIDVKMLGAFEVRRGGVPIQGHEWGRQKNRLLLKYFLAHRGTPITQEQLIEVIYSERPSMALSRNLLGRISEVRRILEPDLKKGNQSTFIVRVNQGTYLFPAEAPCTTDVEAFDEAMRQGGSLFAREQWKPASHAYKRALDLYAGDFLAEDLYEEWTTPLRERLRVQFREALINAGTCRIELGAFQDAIREFDRAIELDRADQAAFRGKIAALYHMSDLNRALQTFEELEQVLEDEGYDPDPETHELRRALLSGSLERKAPATPHNLQKPATPFFGREREISLLLKELADPANRVITLLGTGGIGKTRLAIETAFRCLPSFGDGIYLVSVPHDATSAQLISAIVSAVGISLQAQQDSKEQVLTAMRDKSILLLIDNGEHALKATGVLEEIVQSTSVRLLAMSRERLHVAGELLIELHGLEYLQGDEAGVAAAQSLAGFSATQLFVDRMRRVNHEFALSDATARDVARICKFAGGMPLALELAASWGRALSCREIADGIEESLRFLDRTADTSSEQRSVRAIFDHTWSLLTPDEQRIFATLSVFVGGMSPDAALSVANAPLSSIVALRDKALVQRADADRYMIHELLRQFAAEKLGGDPDLEQTAHKAHARYFCKLAASNIDALNGSEQTPALARLQPDAENLEAAWRWLVNHGRVDDVAAMMEGYARFLDLKNRWQEWIGLLTEAIERFRAETDPTAGQIDARRTLGRLLVMYATANLSVGTPAEANKALDESLTIAKDTGDSLLEGLSLSGLGSVYQINGRHEESERALRQSLDLLKSKASGHDVARTLSKLGVTLRLGGKRDESEAAFLECLETYRSLGDPTEIAGTLANLATLYGAQGKLDAAIRYFEEGLELATQSGHRHLMLVCTMNLGFIAYIKKDYATAKSRCLEAWEIASEIGHQEGKIFARYYLALVCPRTGDFDEAEEYIRAGMKQSMELQATASTLRFVYALGRLQQLKGRLTDAIALFSFALGHESISVPTRNDINTDMAQIEASLTEAGIAQAEVAAAKERGKSLSLEEIWSWIENE